MPPDDEATAGGGPPRRPAPRTGTDLVTDDRLAALIQTVEDRSASRVQRLSGWVPVAITALTILVGATAYLAPMRDEIDRLEITIQNLSEDTLQKDLRLSERIDGVQDNVEAATATTSARLAAIQADVSVIKSQIDQAYNRR